MVRSVEIIDDAPTPIFDSPHSRNAAPRKIETRQIFAQPVRIVLGLRAMDPGALKTQLFGLNASSSVRPFGLKVAIGVPSELSADRLSNASNLCAERLHAFIIHILPRAGQAYSARD